MIEILFVSDSARRLKEAKRKLNKKFTLEGKSVENTHNSITIGEKVRYTFVESRLEKLCGRQVDIVLSDIYEHTDLLHSITQESILPENYRIMPFDLYEL